jgi:hypothetical protein
MFDDAEKEKIRAEEIFRQEVRKELEAQKQQPRGWKWLWSLANTSFSIWFLSTIVVGFVTWSYSSVQERARSNASKAETVQKLDTELAGRVQGALATMQALQRRLEAKAYFETRSATFGEAVDALGRANSIYPEYRERSFGSLVLELQRLLPASDQPPLRMAQAGYRELKFTAESGNRSGMIGKNIQLDESQMKGVANNIAEAREIISTRISTVAGWKVE